MAFNVNAFQGAMKFGGARSSLFEVNITNPVNGISDIDAPFKIRASQIPSATVGVIETPYFGRRVKFAGNRIYPEWSVVCLNDEDFLLRNALEEWSHKINGAQSNLREFEAASPTLYKSTAQVTQFSKTGVPLRVYNFIGLWPADVQAIDLGWDQGDQIQEFSCTFVYDYWEVSGGITGNGGT